MYKFCQGKAAAFYIGRLKNMVLDEDRTELLLNDAKTGQKILASIERELKKCDEFLLSVAFITLGGITPLLMILRELAERGVRGRILTTDYLLFSEPRALAKLDGLKNIELKIYRAKDDGFHAKGYIFKSGRRRSLIVGSANLTLGALTKNEEWSAYTVLAQENEYSRAAETRFDALWHDAASIFYRDFRAAYEKMYKEKMYKEKMYKSAARRIIEDSPCESVLRPNLMQQAFCRNLQAICEKGGDRAMLISATGTGKTYASAFAAKRLKARRLLFIVHREQIARQAKESYGRVFGEEKSLGILSGTSCEIGADYIFATMQMMAKAEIREKFSPREFDMIIIDEVHRAGAASYQRIMEYFRPRLWLGMTASPERTDGFDIYGLFSHQIAYEIRLKEALSEDLLCPFHYFGIADLIIEGEEVFPDDYRRFNNLMSDRRADYIIEKAKYYGYSGERVKGLVFCSRREEAKELSEKFNRRGFFTAAVCGDDGQDARQAYIERLAAGEGENRLDYIFTVDIFNEGVDIPEINQVIMLRPTTSPIIFIQQLGRGLRKHREKEYVVILDFIGNYLENNFFIPIALTGDFSYNKDNIRRSLFENMNIITGASTVHFDAIARKRIYDSIDRASFGSARFLRENYLKLKEKLGRVPHLADFAAHGEMDALLILQKLRSYHAFLRRYEKEYTVNLSELAEKYLEFVSFKLAAGKRIHELELLKMLLSENENGEGDIIKRLEVRLNKKYAIKFGKNTRQNIINVLTGNFQTGAGKAIYKDCVFLDEKDGEYTIGEKFSLLLKDKSFKEMLSETIEFGAARYEKYYHDSYKDSNLALYRKYTYEDVCRILEWDYNLVPLDIGGYRYDKKSHTLPVFITHDQAADLKDSIKYEHRFINSGEFISISKNNRSLDSEDVKTILNAEELGIRIDLFVRKNKNDKQEKSFYYLGSMKIIAAKPFIMAKSNRPAVEFHWKLDTRVRDDIYEYIVKG